MKDDKEQINLPKKDNDRAWILLEKMALLGFEEQKRTRRWKIFFRVVGFFWLFFIAGSIYLLQSTNSSLSPIVNGDYADISTPFTAMVTLDGYIDSSYSASADKINSSLNKAFQSPNSKAVILKINSGGGSPVQSAYIYDEITRLKNKYPKKKIYAVISDIGASGAYYVASATDQIYANPASIVGSIGVISNSFGYTGLLEKLGVTRRLYHAGEFKGYGDSFSKENKTATQLFQNKLNQIHQQFIHAVKKGRGNRINQAKSQLIFSGMDWTGEEALTLGLIDGFGSTSQVARDIIGNEKIIEFKNSKNLFMENVSKYFSEGISAAIIKTIKNNFHIW